MGFLSSLFADRKCDKKRRASRAASRNRLSSALKPLKLIGESLERRELLAIFTWDGGGADNMWMTGANWVGDVAPSAITDELRFSGSARTGTQNDFAAGTSFKSIEFAASNFSLTGNALTVTDGIKVDSTVTGSTIGLGIALGGTVTVDVATTLTISGTLSSSGSLVKTGSGTLTLSSANGYSGGTTISAGTLDAENNTALGTGIVHLNGGTLGAASSVSAVTLGNAIDTGTSPTISVIMTYASHTLTLNGNISGSGRIERADGVSSILNLGGDNSGFSGIYSEAGHGSAATYFTSASAGSASAMWNIAFGTFASNISGTSTIHLGALSGYATNAMAGSTVTFVIGERGDSTTVSQLSNGSGTVALIKAGSGTLTLSSANGYTGGTTISAGTLNAENNTALGTGIVHLNGGTLGAASSVSAVTLGNAIDTGTSPTISVIMTYASHTLTLNGNISGSGRIERADGVSSILNLGGDNSGFSGIYSEAGHGSAATYFTSASAGSASAMWNIAFGTFASNISGTSTIHLGALSGYATNAMAGSTVTFVIGERGDSTTVSQLSNGSGTVALIKAGSGTLTLSSANGYTGGTTISAGTLNAENNTALGTGIVHLNGGTLGAASSVSAVTLGNAIDTGTSPTISVIMTYASHTLTLNGNISGSGRIERADGVSSILNLGGDNSGFSGIYSEAGHGSAATYFTSASAGSASALWNIAFGTFASNISGTSTIHLGALSGYATNAMAGSTVTFVIGERGDSTTVSQLSNGSGTVALTKAGSGTLTLSGANSYTGGTTINGGTLSLGNANAIGTTGTITFGGGTLQYTSANTTDYSSRFSAAANQTYRIDTNGQNVTLASALASSGGTLGKLGSGTLSLTGNNTQGNTYIYNGVLNINSDSALGSASGSVVISGGATLQAGASAVSLAATRPIYMIGGVATFDTQGNTMTIASAITNVIMPAGIAKTGSGTLILTGNNAYTGGTTINGGTLSLGNANAIGTTGTITFGGGTLQYTSANTTDYSSRFSAAANQTYRIDTNGQNVTLASALASSGGTLGKLGSGTLSLTGNNTQGNTYIYNGVLNINSDSALGSASGSVVISGGATLQAGASAVSLAATRPIYMIGGVATFDTQGNTMTIASAITNVIMPAGIAKTGSGTLILTGNNAYTGGTTINGGTLSLGNANAIGTTGTITFGGGTLQYTSANTTDYSSRFSAAANQTYRIDTNGQNVTLASALASSGGTLGKLGSGTLSLTGNNTQGNTYIYNGVLNINSDSALGSASGSVVISGGATLQAGASAVSLAATRPIYMIGGVATFDTQGNTMTIASAITNVIMPAGIAKTGSGTLILSGANTYSGGTTVNGGTLQLGASDRLPDAGSVTVSSGGTLDLQGYSDVVGAVTLTSGSIIGTGTLTGTSYAVQSGTISANLAGTNTALTKTGLSTVTLSGTNNTYGNGTTVSEGTLQTKKAASLPGYATSNKVAVSSGAALAVDVGGAGTTEWQPVEITALLNAATFNANSAIGFDTTSGDFTYGGAISDTANGSRRLAKFGTNTLTLTGTNTYTGATILVDGKLSLGSANPIGTTGIISFNGGTLQFTSSNTTDYSGRFGTITDYVMYRVDTNGQSVTLAATLPQMFKMGEGTLTLSGNNPCPGATTFVLAGTLCVTGSNGLGVALYDGATLSGTGTAGPVSTTDGTVSPGISGVGTLNIVGGLTLATGCNYNVDLTDTGNDQLNVTGTVTLGGATLNLTSTRSGNGGVALVLIRNDGTDLVSGTFAGLAQGATVTVNGVTYTITYAYNADGGTVANDVALVDQTPVSQRGIPGYGAPGGPDFEAISDAGVLYSNGDVFLSVDDLGAGGTRSYSTQFSSTQDLGTGYGWQLDDMPYLADASGEAAVTFGAEQTYWYTVSGDTCTAKFGALQKMTHDSTNHLFKFTDTDGTVYQFDDFTYTGSRHGQFRRKIEPGGNTADVYSWTADGRIAEIRYTLSGAAQPTESQVYTWTNGKITSVLSRENSQSASISWVNSRQVTYTYYGAGESYGLAGDLKTALCQTFDGTNPVGSDTNYYRYYVDTAGGIGFAHGLKMVFAPEEYAAAVAALGSNPDLWSDANASTYCTRQYKYDSTNRRVTETINSGNCTHTFVYTASPFTTDGYNTWKRKAVETLQNGVTNTVYTNYLGQTILTDLYDPNSTTQPHTLTYNYRDTDGRLIFSAQPSAFILSGGARYSESYADLVNHAAANSPYLSDTAGLYEITTYYAADGSGGAKGYVHQTAVANGETATPIVQAHYTYVSHTANSTTTFKVYEYTAYANTDGTGASLTTYAYTWCPTTLLPGLLRHDG